MKAKSSYQRMTEKYHHAVIELGLKDKKIKELNKQLEKLQKEIELQAKTPRLSKVHGSYERTVFCDDEPDKGNNWQPKEQPEPSDPYQIFRDAIKDGKTIQFQDGLNNWVDPDDESKQKWGFIYPPEYYRIKPESEPEPSDPYQVFRDAIKEGKTVQYCIDGEWTTSKREWAFDRHHSCYRIKPEPELTPFDKVPHDSLINQIISNNASGELLVITRVRKDTVVAGNIEIKYDHLFKYYSLYSGAFVENRNDNKN